MARADRHPRQGGESSPVTLEVKRPWADLPARAQSDCFYQQRDCTFPASRNARSCPRRHTDRPGCYAQTKSCRPRRRPRPRKSTSSACRPSCASALICSVHVCPQDSLTHAFSGSSRSTRRSATPRRTPSSPSRPRARQFAPRATPSGPRVRSHSSHPFCLLGAPQLTLWRARHPHLLRPRRARPPPRPRPPVPLRTRDARARRVRGAPGAAAC